MKKVKKHIALFLAFLMALSLLPGFVLAEAAEETYTLLCEPNIVGGFENETYGNVAAVWEDVYYDPVSGQILENIKSNWDKGYRKPMHLMAADKSGVHAVSDWYQTITGLSADGFAAAKNFNGKWGVIDFAGNVVIDFKYDNAYMPTDDGYVYVVTHKDKEGHQSRTEKLIIDLKNDITYDADAFTDEHGFILGTGGRKFYLYDKSLDAQYGDIAITANGYTIVENNKSWSDPDKSRMIVNETGTLVLSDAGKNYMIGGYRYSLRGDQIVGKEGLVLVQGIEEGNYGRYGGKYGYANLAGELVVPLEYPEARDFHNGYAAVYISGSGYGLIDTQGYVVTPINSSYDRRYRNVSNASNSGIVWCRDEYYPSAISTVYQVEPRSSQDNQPPIRPDHEIISDEYIYNSPESNDNLDLPTENLDNVSDGRSAVEAVKDLVNRMTEAEKTSPICIDLATLYAETAVAKAASRVVEGNDILVDASSITELGNIAAQTSVAVETTLESGGVTTARYLSTTVTLVIDETDITVRIDPDVLTTEVDKVRVETPSYALTFKLSDLAPDLTQTLTFTAKSAVADSAASSAGVSSFSGSVDGQGPTTISRSILANAAVPAVEIDMTGGKTTNSITVSLPNAGGDTTYQTVASADGTATASKYNPATTMMDGKVNTSGKYTVMTNEKDFTDISNKSAEMQAAIRYLASKGIINGTSETTFSPDGSISRAEIATLLVKALGKLDSTAVTSFSDVTKGNWFYTAAASSQRHKLINGYEDNTFRGTNDISKVQIVAVSSRVLSNEMNYKAPGNPAAYLSKYKDTVANWAQSEVALATKENLVVYRTDGTFSGDKNMTRGDAAIIIYRLFQRIW